MRSILRDPAILASAALGVAIFAISRMLGVAFFGSVILYLILESIIAPPSRSEP